MVMFYPILHISIIKFYNSRVNFYLKFILMGETGYRWNLETNKKFKINIIMKKKKKRTMAYVTTKVKNLHVEKLMVNFYK